MIAVFLTNKNNKLQKDIAKEQGIYSHPNIELSSYLSCWTSPIPNNILIATKVPENGMILFPLQITLTNEGDKSGNRINLVLRYPKELRMGGRKLVEPTVEYCDSSLKEPKFLENSNFQLVSFEFDRLAPKESVSLCDYISIKNATIDLSLDVNAVLGDGAPVVVTAEFTYGYVIDYAIYQDDHDPISGTIKVRIYDTSNKTLDDYITSENRKQLEKYKALSFYQKYKLRQGKYQKDGRMQVVTSDVSKIECKHKGLLGRVLIDDIQCANYYIDITGQMTPIGTFRTPDVYK
jgi:hypothetical protein